MLQQLFTNTALTYTQNLTLVEECWQQIKKQYSAKGRYYHTLQHLQNMFAGLTMVKDILGDWDVLVFALFYHDVVYNPLKQDNEEKSAALAEKRLNEFGVPVTQIKACKQQILATKAHAAASDTDTNLFTDADLSILGQPDDVYKAYCRQIRQEYAIYPDIIYNPGRKKVLQHFLQMQNIYKTGIFYNLYEEKARENMKQELLVLGAEN
jgi:predicted metal-dependent HD superfamily phosphohydrolase